MELASLINNNKTNGLIKQIIKNICIHYTKLVMKTMQKLIEKIDLNNNVNDKIIIKTTFRYFSS